ncbi:unnamed protein product [Mytilus edulis]|uniref:Uncharacterized protein n=1 Tax=Mytilus edulis TaxID=6550 RepID=A0A8S3QC95_MYTED|nr:unnamed protein product [Mytilus edulis]
MNSSSPLQVYRSEVQVKRTFSGSIDDVLADFLRYFEIIATLNAWNEERNRLVFFTILRGQVETYVQGLSSYIQMRWQNFNFFKDGVTVWTFKHERKIPCGGKIKKKETWRAYPSHPELVQENSIRSFLDACCESEEFCMFIRRTKPKTLQEAVSSAMQEECIRMNEGNVNKVNRRNNVYTVEKESDVHEPTVKQQPVGAIGPAPTDSTWWPSRSLKECTLGKRRTTRSTQTEGVIWSLDHLIDQDLTPEYHITTKQLSDGAFVYLRKEHIDNELLSDNIGQNNVRSCVNENIRKSRYDGR